MQLFLTVTTKRRLIIIMVSEVSEPDVSRNITVMMERQSYSQCESQNVTEALISYV